MTKPVCLKSTNVFTLVKSVEFNDVDPIANVVAFASFMFKIELPLRFKLADIVNPFCIPNDVIFGCAAVDNVPVSVVGE